MPYGSWDVSKQSALIVVGAVSGTVVLFPAGLSACQTGPFLASEMPWSGRPVKGVGAGGRTGYWGPVCPMLAAYAYSYSYS